MWVGEIVLIHYVKALDLISSTDTKERKIVKRKKIKELVLPKLILHSVCLPQKIYFSIHRKKKSLNIVKFFGEDIKKGDTWVKWVL